MNEKDKMLSGVLYNPMCDELVSDRLYCKNICGEYNRLDYDKFEQRAELLKRILGKTGENYTIEQSFYCDYGYNIELGENFYSNHNLVILDCAKVKFGDNVFIGPNCGFYTAEHPIDAKTRNKFLEYAHPITVGNSVWFGGHVTVLSGVNIGDNVVIGAGSVVTKDIPSNVVAVGNPARVIREIKNS